MDGQAGTYDFKRIEQKWQGVWQERKTFRAKDCDSSKPKYYVLDMFPYPSGQGLHVGHPEGYTASDIVARYKRMKGFNVLHPFGWDAFGLPAEQHAIQTGADPAETTFRNILNMRRQTKSLGLGYDWDREIATTDPEYYTWTQWIFLKLFHSYFDDRQQKARPLELLPIPAGLSEPERRRFVDEHRLAYQADVPVNWCPALGTVLANEEVIGGVSERGGHPVIRKPMRQWMLRITKYADRLLEDLALVDWTESIKKLQADWIGKSVGAEVCFALVLGWGLPHQKAGKGPGWRNRGTRWGKPHPTVKGAELEESRNAVGLAPPGSREGAELEESRNAVGQAPPYRNAVGQAPPYRNFKLRTSNCLWVFTTRPDTLFGATYLVLAPEHPLVDVITTPRQEAAVRAYREAAARKSDLDRTDLARDKTGVFTGAYAINPVNDEKIPIWIGDYVLISYGTGAIMAVPAHDDRDFEFAQKFDLPILPVVEPPDPQDAERVRRAELCFTGNGIASNSGPFTGLPTPEFKEKITAWLAERGLGRKAVNYKLRDWLFSRQRYWGEPFPILHTEDGRVVGLSEEELPLRLPEVEDYRPPGTGESPLAKATEWLNVTLPDGTRAQRETNTMPQWAGSCWYYLRYLDPENSQRAWDPAKEKYWMPVDLYIGGAEHAVLHLLYSRFWHKFLYDLGYVSTKEPFQKLINQGMILGADGQKMSKSRGNVVNPDEVIAAYGADAMRLYEMFMGPLEAMKPWSMQGVQGVYRFLQKAWRTVVDEETGELAAAIRDAEEVTGGPWPVARVAGVPPSGRGPEAPDTRGQDVRDTTDHGSRITSDEETVRLLHQTIRKVGGDIETFAFNTAISAMMIFLNHLARQEVRPRSVVEPFVLLLAPFAPHIAEELWQRLGHRESLAYESWPQYDEALAQDKQIELGVQINGKLRDRVVVPADWNEDQIKAQALAAEKIVAALAGKTPKKVIVVKGRLVSIVV